MGNNNISKDSNTANLENEDATASNTANNSDNTTSNVPKALDIDKMALTEYIEVVRNEYEMERNKK